MKANTESSVESFFEKIRLKLEDVAAYFNMSSQRLIQLAIIFGVALVGGFVFKKYGRQLFIFSLIIIASLLILSYFQFIMIDWQSFKMFLGLQSNQSVDAILQTYSAWVKTHIPEVVSGIIGFIIGYYVG